MNFRPALLGRVIRPLLEEAGSAEGELSLMTRTGRQQEGQPPAASRWPRAAGISILLPLAAGRAALLVVAAGILVLLVVFAAVVAGAAFAPRQQARESAARTLDLLLRAIPGYRPLVEPRGVCEVVVREPELAFEYPLAEAGRDQQVALA